MKRTILLACVLAVLFAGGLRLYGAFNDRAMRQQIIAETQNVVVPVAEPKPSKDESVKIVREPVAREEINWDVPFTPQAPFANWDEVHGEACEEASALMVLRYFADKPFESPEEADREIVRLVKRNEEELGLPVDQTAQQVAALIALENKRLRVSVVANPTEESIKQALDKGSLIIIPAAGSQLGNPYYQNPGPIYHMLVIRGYTKNGYVITNDPGTKRGEGFVYKWDVLLSAIHDWNNGDVDNGDKAMIVVGQYVIEEESF